ARGIEALLENGDLRRRLATAGREFVERAYGWRRIGRQQALLWKEVLTGISIRNAKPEDIKEIRRIQLCSSTASHWEPESYFEFNVTVAERDGRICGFMVYREVAGETEVLNLATAPETLRQGVATTLLESL